MHQWIRPPAQARSKETLNRILDATESLMATGGYEAASITEIVRRAGTSTGAFYTRFENKEALFHALHERFLADADRRLRERSEGVTNEQSLEGLVRWLVESTLALYREHTGLLKAAYYHTRISPSPEFVERARNINQHLVQEVERILMSRGDEITHPRPREATRFVVTLVGSTMRECVVFGRSGTVVDSSGLLPGPSSSLSASWPSRWMRYLPGACSSVTPTGRSAADPTSS